MTAGGVDFCVVLINDTRMKLSRKVVQIITDIKLHKEVTLVIIMLSGQSDVCQYMFALCLPMVPG